MEKTSTARPFYERFGYRLAGKLAEQYSYTTPDGAVMHIQTDQWVLRKPLRRRKRRTVSSQSALEPLEQT